jgi:hypothetical protein
MDGSQPDSKELGDKRLEADSNWIGGVWTEQFTIEVQLAIAFTASLDRFEY